MSKYKNQHVYAVGKSDLPFSKIQHGMEFSNCLQRQLWLWSDGQLSREAIWTKWQFTELFPPHHESRVTSGVRKKKVS